MRVLFLSNLFPDASAPTLGLDNATLLHHLRRRCEVRVLSPRFTLPVPTGRAPTVCRGEDAVFQPTYPRVCYVPKVGSRWNHRLFARGIGETLQRVRAQFPFDVVLCAWLYPDGCAVRRLAAAHGWPFVLIAQGSDVHAFLRYRIRRPLIVDAANASRGVVTRSIDLATRLEAAGARSEQLHPIHNGVDTALFAPGDRDAARAALGLPRDAALLLFVGNLRPVKNPLVLLEAHAEAARRLHPRRCDLVFVGDGPLRDRLRARADALGSGGNVHLVGRRPPHDVAAYLSAADLLCMSSDAEGVPNVVLEALASGRRVVATNVGGIREVVRDDALGRLVPPRDASALADGICDTLAEPPRIDDIARVGRSYSWERCADAYLAILERAAAAPPDASAA